MATFSVQITDLVGGTIDQAACDQWATDACKEIMPLENEAIKEANKMGQELKSIPLEGVEADFPIADARDRMETYQLGGQVKSPTTPSINPTPQYEKGGEVK